jgi:thiosulfate/3-mercaptopyruvate sulfurtransferase
MSRWLICATELLACHRHPDVVVVDCRFSLADPAMGERQYREGHIPGAHYLHLERDLSGPKGARGGRHPLPDATAFATAMRRIGVNSDPPSLVVAYDDSHFGFAARLWWLLRWCGHERVRLLDGGLRAWRREAGQALSEETPHVAAGNFVAAPRADMTVDQAQVAALSARLRDGAGGAALIDSREERRYLGLEEPIDPVAGHIPGAINFPWQQVMDEEGHLLPEEEQRAHWGEAADPETLVVYCGSGVTACVNLLSLAEVGRDDARLYPGSWSDWISAQ